jgi:FkbM family methyltransferase
MGSLAEPMDPSSFGLFVCDCAVMALRREYRGRSLALTTGVCLALLLMNLPGAYWGKIRTGIQGALTFPIRDLSGAESVMAERGLASVLGFSRYPTPRCCFGRRDCSSSVCNDLQQKRRGSMFEPLFPDLAGCFEAEREFFFALKEAGLRAENVFDVGSSTGGWSCMMSQIFTGARFFLFDPLVGLKPTYEDGTTRTLNALPGSQFFKLALGDRNERRMMLTDSSGFSSSLITKSPTEVFSEKVPISVRRLDDLLAEKNLPIPDILKMDVQGGEMLVLSGLGDNLKQVKVIQTEAWFVRGYGPETPLFHELHEFLSASGFILIDVGERFYAGSHELYCCDVFFAQRHTMESLKTPLATGPLS